MTQQQNYYLSNNMFNPAIQQIFFNDETFAGEIEQLTTSDPNWEARKTGGTVAIFRSRAMAINFVLMPEQARRSPHRHADRMQTNLIF